MFPIVRRTAPGICRTILAPARLSISPSASLVAFPMAAKCRGFSIFNGGSRMGAKMDDKLDMKNLLSQSAWTRDELDKVEKTHREPRDWVDRAAYYTVQALRGSFDIGSLYKVKNMTGGMRESDWVRRIIFLETVAGVPGMVAGMLRHLHSLRLMRRDYGWIHSLLAEAENERMHLLIALSLRQPGALFRAAVIGGQALFLSWYTLAYLVCPRYCHRFVGYLEEEAVHTYSKLLVDIDAGKLPLFENLQAPRMARVYYNLPEDAMLRDVFERIRADECAHRDTNHHFSDLRPDEPNTMVEHLRQGHFQNQNVFSGLVVDKVHEMQEQEGIELLRKGVSDSKKMGASQPTKAA
mmetsp:Transcript_109753/g.354074  ORF Transcript_109753/g.354074 Transcript_109753/m.354074 type:complete len:352 (+) Transcript_109753:78-1133(+)